MLGQQVVHFTPAGGTIEVIHAGETCVTASGERVGRAVRNEAEDARFIVKLLLAMLFKLHIGVILMRIKVIFLKAIRMPLFNLSH